MSETTSGTARQRLYDSHAHLVSDDPVRYPRNGFVIAPPPDGRPAIRKPFGGGTVGIPGGMHGPNPVNEKPTAEQMHGWMAELGVVAIAAVQKGMIYGTDNSYIVDAAALFPHEMRAVVILDPDEAHTMPTIRKLGVARDGSPPAICGVRFFPVNVADKVAWLTSPAALEVWESCAELGLIVDLEAPPYDAEKMMPVVCAMADRFPSLQIVLDHVMMPVVTDPQFGIDARYDGMAARDNVTYKFTSLNMDVIREQGVAPDDVLRRAVDYFGPDKLMWGSDIGTSSGTYREMVGRAFDACRHLDDGERAKVLHDTGRRVFTGWDGRD